MARRKKKGEKIHFQRHSFLIPNTSPLQTTPTDTWTFDFSKVLIFPVIDHVTFSLESNTVTYCVSNPPAGTSVTIACKDKVTGKMSVTVDSSTSTFA